jgi:hypothetical protein
MVINKEAVPHPIHGWMCECLDPGPFGGDIHWVKGDDDTHHILTWKNYK